MAEGEDFPNPRLQSFVDVLMRNPEKNTGPNIGETKTEREVLDFYKSHV